MTEAELRAYARVVLEVGLDLRPGRDVAINALLEHAPFARIVCDEAYARGAELVDVWYWDPHTKLSRLRHAPAESLGRVPPWLDARYADLSERNGALVNLVGDPRPDLLRGIDPERAGRDRMPGLASRFRAQAAGAVEWTFAAVPTAGWAERVLGRPDVDELWRHLRRIVRLDEPDPVSAWRERMAVLAERCAALEELGLDAVELRGPGTDLLVGLPERHRWGTAEVVSQAGVRHVPNLPTEEIFTTPDPARAEGTVRATRPLALGGSLIQGLELSFARGQIVDVRATSGADVVRGHVASDAGASRLGEVALVDDSSRVLRSGLVFLETLLDENAASHLAWGNGIATGHRDYDPRDPTSAERLPINRSATHTDFMVGGPDVTVTGIRRGGERRTLLEGERWCL
jgi:aminopeptidase